LSENSIIPVNIDITPTDIERAINLVKLQRQGLDRIFRECMVSGVDHDRVPGTDKPTLLKAGAELLCQIFRLSPGKLEILNSERDLDRNFISYEVGMHITHRESGLQVSYGVGAANSYEKKYRWRKSKDEETGEEIQIQNPDIMDQHNTFLKMAAKRAFVDGVLKATGASRLFTQDMEDLDALEAPSKKQIDLVKKICKGKTEQEILVMFSEYLSREVAEWSDVSRQEVSTWIDQNKPANWAAKQSLLAVFAINQSPRVYTRTVLKTSENHCARNAKVSRITRINLLKANQVTVVWIGLGSGWRPRKYLITSRFIMRLSAILISPT